MLRHLKTVAEFSGTIYYGLRGNHEARSKPCFRFPQTVLPPLRGESIKADPAGDVMAWNKGGRPKVADDELRQHRVNVRLTHAEKAALIESAEKMGMHPATWLRQAALKRRLPPPPVPAVNIKKYGELGKLSGILNQLAKAAHQGKVLGIKPEDLARVKNEVDALRRDLLGLTRGE